VVPLLCVDLAPAKTICQDPRDRQVGILSKKWGGYVVCFGFAGWALSRREADVAKVAVVEDETRIADNWGTALEDAGHQVTKFYAARPALEVLTVHPPEVLVVDHVLRDDMPEFDGYELLLKLRKEWRTRGAEVKVIIVSAVRTELTDELVARKVADEFMKKQVGDTPLLLHLVEKVARNGQQAPLASTSREHGRLVLDERTRTCRWQGEKINLTRAEWAIIWALIEDPGSTKRPKELAQITDTKVDTIRDIISDIRRKFTAVDPRFEAIKNVRGVGYRFEDGA
jgi:DNA-binding response OmpR family regulator